jgi:hypothetical protein
MVYFMLHFIPGGQQIFSQLVCNESAKILAFVICRGGCCCGQSQLLNAVVTVLLTLGWVGV